MRIAVVAACAYGIWKWQGFTSGEGDTETFARNACVDEIRNRYKATNARAYDIEKNNSGYVVRATATLSRGQTAKVICTMNTNGGLRDIMIEER